MLMFVISLKEGFLFIFYIFAAENKTHPKKTHISNLYLCMKTNFYTTFLKTIFTSVFMTVFLFGNTFAQLKTGSSKQPIALSPETPGNNLKNPQPMINGCDTVNYVKGFGTPKVWTAYTWTAGAPNSGLVYGTNSLGDKAKGDYIDLSTFTTATHITGTFVWFAKAYSTNTAKTVSVNVYDNSGAAGSPGTLLGSQTLTMATIMANAPKGYLTRVVFTSPIAIPVSKKVFVTCDYSNLTWTNAPGTDSLSIVASDTLQENPGLVWEKTSVNAWHKLDDLTTWKLRKAALFIFPFVTNNIAAPTATVTVTPANGIVCTNATISFNATGSTNTYGSGWWASPNSGYSSANINGQTLSLTYTLASTYTVGYNSYGCGTVATASTAITVNPSPTVTASSNSPVCQGASLQFTSTTNATSFAWIGPNAYTSSQQNPVISPASTANSGTYAVTVTSANSCTNTQLVNVIVNPCTGIEPINMDEEIYINENENQQYFLVMDNHGEGIKISIFNINGELMSSLSSSGATKIELNTSKLCSGMYFVQVHSAERIFTKKIIITR
jgi:hypothetical protein